MTPMQKLKGQFGIFNEILGDTFKEIVLNKSAQKDTYIGSEENRIHYHDKGVESDFVRLYRVQFNEYDTFTIAFVFKYLNLEEQDHRVTFCCSIGLKDKIYSDGVEMTVLECREHLKKIVSTLKTDKQLENNDNEATKKQITEQLLSVIQEEFLNKDFFALNKKNKMKKIR